MQPPPTTHLAKESPYSDRYCPLESPVSSTSALHGSAGKLMLKRMCSISSRRVSTFICRRARSWTITTTSIHSQHPPNLNSTCARAFCTRRYERQRCASHTKRMRGTAHPNSVTAARGDTLQGSVKERPPEPQKARRRPPCRAWTQRTDSTVHRSLLQMLLRSAVGAEPRQAFVSGRHGCDPATETSGLAAISYARHSIST